MTAAAARVAYSPVAWGGGGGGGGDVEGALLLLHPMVRLGEGEETRSVLSGLQVLLPLAHHQHHH